MKKTVNLTAAGYAELEKELAELIAQRPAIAERIATARAFGDLSENQEYTHARAEQKTLSPSAPLSSSIWAARNSPTPWSARSRPIL